MEDLEALVAAADAAKLVEQQGAVDGRASTPEPAQEKGGKRKRAAKKSEKKSRKTKRHRAQSSAGLPRKRESASRVQGPRYAPQQGQGNPWTGIRFIADTVKVTSAAVRKALARHISASPLVLGTHFRSSEQVLEVAWQGDRVGWGVRWIGDSALGPNEMVGVFAGLTIAIDGAPTLEQARWIFDTSAATADGERIYIDLQRTGNALRYANHSCDPNCVARLGSVNGLMVPVLFVRGKRVLARGDWISFSYAPKEATARTALQPNLRCKCGTAICKGWIFPPTEQEAADHRKKCRAKLQRKLEKLDEQRAGIVDRIAALQTPAPLSLSGDLPPMPVRKRLQRPRRTDGLTIPNSFFSAGHISHQGVTYHRTAQPQASGAFGVVWYLWRTAECTGSPQAVLKVATPITIDTEIFRWKRTEEGHLNTRAPLFPTFLGQVNRGFCSPKIPRNLAGIVLSYTGRALGHLPTDSAITMPLSANNVRAAAFQLLWAVRALQYHCRLQHSDLHHGNITYVVQPSLITAWNRQHVWQFDTLLIVRIIDLGNAKEVKPSEASLHEDMKCALNGLAKICRRQRADVSELHKFIRDVLNNNSLRSSTACDREYFRALKSRKTPKDISAVVQQQINVDPVVAELGMIIEPSKPVTSGGVLGELCAVCCFLSRKEGKEYCKSPACKAKIKGQH